MRIATWRWIARIRSPRHWARSQRETRYEHLQLKGLERAEVGQLLETIADQEVPDALVAAISAETSGNPFFIREVLLHLVEEGKIFRA